MPMCGQRLTIGRGESADLSIDDRGLSRLHLSIYRNDDKIWVMDEDSTNGSQVNGVTVPASGAPLNDGDKIALGDSTTIWVAIAGSGAKPVGSVRGGLASVSSLSFAGLVVLGIAILVGGGLLAARLIKNSDANRNAGSRIRIDNPEGIGRDAPPGSGTSEAATSNAFNSNTGAGALTGTNRGSENSNTASSKVSQGGGVDDKSQQARKLYLQMTESERNDFIYRRARDISRMMSSREYVFTDDVLPYIKHYVDGYAGRVGNNSQRLWGEDLNTMFVRAREFAPDIIRAFNQGGVPPVVGLYIVMIETEYHNIRSENFAGAAGLFQFIGPTARAYGVDPSDRTDVKKMAPAAARYMGQRISDFGTDAMSVALGIAGYNRNPESVMRDLHDVLNSDNEERSFWTLVANSTKLDRHFQDENVKYVPKFFAAAVIGETPWSFGLQMRPLSTYAEGPER